ncbi:MAG: hypothetical protein GEU99_22815 [Luteitalea sp.]|nr:hypothetical protein [Luteitalea sp.]
MEPLFSLASTITAIPCWRCCSAGPMPECIRTVRLWTVMVKDNVGRFPGNKLWGAGCGWAWFEATDPQKTTSTDYTTDCQSCHVSARASDWIYTRGYPPLNQ